MPGLPSDMGRACAGEKLNNGCNVARAGNSAQGHLTSGCVDFVFAHALAGLGRVGDAGCNGIDPNLVRRQCHGAGAGEPHQARFAGDVMGRARRAAKRGARGDVDDAAATPLRDHAPRRLLGA